MKKIIFCISLLLIGIFPIPPSFAQIQIPSDSTINTTIQAKDGQRASTTQTSSRPAYHVSQYGSVLFPPEGGTVSVDFNVSSPIERVETSGGNIPGLKMGFSSNTVYFDIPANSEYDNYISEYIFITCYCYDYTSGNTQTINGGILIEQEKRVQPNGGSIRSDQTISPGEQPYMLNSNSLASDFPNNTQPRYSWEYKEVGSSTWQKIPGATDGTSCLAPALEYNTEIRRKAETQVDYAYSNTIRITVRLNGGTIKSRENGANENYIYIDHETGHLGGARASTYQWQRSKDNGFSWINIQNETSESFSGERMFVDNLFRRKVTSPDDGQEAYSNVIFIPASTLEIFMTKQNDKSGLVRLSCKRSPDGSRFQWQNWRNGCWRNESSDAIYEFILPTSVYEAYRLVVTAYGKTYYSNTITSGPRNQNYVSKTRYIGSNSLYPDNTQTDITYFDGLGSESQIVNIAAGSSKKDIITPIWYDVMRREDVRTYLPYASISDDAGCDPTPFVNQQEYYNGIYPEKSPAYAEKIYEASPLNRVLGQINAGSDFRPDNDTIRTILRYESNTAHEVIHFVYNYNTRSIDRSTENNGFYPANTLLKNIVINEDSLQTASFADLKGHTILTRSYISSKNNRPETVDTYYIYDDRDLLRWVLSPEGIAALGSDTTLTPNDTIAKQFCYVYDYDGRGRMTSRQLPGKGIEYMVYDKADRQVMTQDAVMRKDATPKWLLKQYDSHDRIIGQRMIDCQQGEDQAYFQSLFDNSRMNDLYSMGVELVATHYDDRNMQPVGLKFEPVIDVVSESDLDNRLTGLQTWQRITILDGDGISNNHIEQAYYYDYKGRVIQTVEKNHLGGISRNSSKYDFTGNVLMNHEIHASHGQNQADIKRTKFTYDHRGRLLTETSCINNSESAVVKYGYDELGKQDSKYYYVQAPMEAEPVPPVDEVLGVEKVELETVYFCLHKEQAALASDMLEEIITRFDPDGIFMVNPEHAKPEYFLGEDDICRYYYIPKSYFHSDGVQSLASYSNDIYTLTSTFPSSVVPSAYVYLAKKPGPEKIGLAIDGYFYLHKEQAANSSEMLKEQIAQWDPDGIFIVNAEHAKPEFFIYEDDTYRYYYVPESYFNTDGVMELTSSSQEIYQLTATFPFSNNPPAYRYTYVRNNTHSAKEGQTPTEIAEIALDEFACFYIHKERAAEASNTLKELIARFDPNGEFMVDPEHAMSRYFITENKTYRYYYIPVSYFHADGAQSLASYSEGIYNLTSTFPGPGQPLASVPENAINYTTPLLTETFDYNIQGWLTNRSSDHLNMTFRYFDPQKGTSPSYTGNITEWTWKHGADGDTNTYAFSYDALSRLKDTKQYINGTASNRFIEQGLNYDKNGNIFTLQRTKAGSLKNNFTYSYTGNQLINLTDSVADQTHSYSYDLNGNMIQDGPNNLDLKYNHLNLIKKAEQGNTTLAEYSYLSNGTKLSATDANGNGLYYLGSLVYESRNGVLSLESTAFSSGRIIAATTTEGIGYSPQFHLTDHLGSVRVIVDKSGKVIEHNDYYPFGLRYGSEGNAATNRYLYNGKEEQKFVNLPYTDYGARMYDPEYRLAWKGIDLFIENHFTNSPYIFCNNNPIRFEDKDGRDWKDKVAGVAIGIVTNILPITSLREGYNPNDADDYNMALMATDDAISLTGTAMSKGGEVTAITGAGIAMAAETVTLATAGFAVEGTVPAIIAGKGIALTGVIAKVSGEILMFNATKNAQDGYNYGNQEQTKPSHKSINQLNNSLKNRNKTNKNITRFDKGKIKGEQNHVHFKDGSALNADGTWKHGLRTLTQEEINFLESNGWTINQ